MRIAFLNSIEAGTFGGMEQWIQLVSSALLKRGHTVFLLGRPQSSFLERVSSKVSAAHPVSLKISGDFNPFTIKKLKDFLLRQCVDLLCVNFNKDVRLGGIAARLAGEVKVVWSVGIDITRNRFVHRWLTPRLVDRVIVPSHSLKSDISRHGYIDESIVDIIPIGIDGSAVSCDREEARRNLRDKYGLPPKARVAVTVGRLVYKKGHEYLVDAAPRIIEKNPDIYFLFLGDGPKREELGQQADRLGLSARVVFAGMLDDVDFELAGADIVIHPSKEEPFGIALLEGMRAGLPIIASRVGGIPEVVVDGETALLFEPRSSVAIADVAIRLLGDPDLMREFGRAGQQRLRRHFSYETMVDRVEAAFNAVVTPLREKNAEAVGGQVNKVESV